MWIHKGFLNAISVFLPCQKIHDVQFLYKETMALHDAHNVWNRKQYSLIFTFQRRDALQAKTCDCRKKWEKYCETCHRSPENKKELSVMPQIHVINTKIFNRYTVWINTILFNWYSLNWYWGLAGTSLDTDNCQQSPFIVEKVMVLRLEMLSSNDLYICGITINNGELILTITAIQIRQKSTHWGRVIILRWCVRAWCHTWAPLAVGRGDHGGMQRIGWKRCTGLQRRETKYE